MGDDRQQHHQHRRPVLRERARTTTTAPGASTRSSRTSATSAKAVQRDRGERRRAEEFPEGSDGFGFTAVTCLQIQVARRGHRRRGGRHHPGEGDRGDRGARARCRADLGSAGVAERRQARRRGLRVPVAVQRGQPGCSSRSTTGSRSRSPERRASPVEHRRGRAGGRGAGRGGAPQRRRARPIGREVVLPDDLLPGRRRGVDVAPRGAPRSAARARSSCSGSPRSWRR